MFPKGVEEHFVTLMVSHTHTSYGGKLIHMQAVFKVMLEKVLMYSVANL